MLAIGVEGGGKGAGAGTAGGGAALATTSLFKAGGASFGRGSGSTSPATSPPGVGAVWDSTVSARLAGSLAGTGARLFSCARLLSIHSCN